MFEQGVETKEVAKFLSEKIRKANIKHKITIIDAYFFSDSKYSITNLMKDILKPFRDEIDTIEIVTIEHKINQNNYNRFRREFEEFDIKIFSSQDFHDRFWIVDDVKAFIVGASMNGIGKKHFFIQDDYLTKEDSKALLNLYKGKEL